MRIDTPTPKLVTDGDYRIWHAGGYGDPNGEIILDEDGAWRLENLNEADCDRLIKAAVEIKSHLVTYRAQMAAPHGRRHLYKGTCQLCGKPEDDALHADPVPVPAPLTADEIAVLEAAARADDDDDDDMGDDPTDSIAEPDDGATQETSPAAEPGLTFHEPPPLSRDLSGDLMASPFPASPFPPQEPALAAAEPPLATVRRLDAHGYVAASSPVLLGAQIGLPS